MLKEPTLFGVRDLETLAIQRIHAFEKDSLIMNEDGYYVAFSGGKDSIVLLDLFRKAGVKHTSHFNLTTVDPPELLKFVLDNYRDVERVPPRINMFDLIRKNRFPPTRLIRYCCSEFKERGGKGRFVATGIRWAESSRRSKRRMTEPCYKNKNTRYLHPIIDWSDADIWEYIKTNDMPYCSLYDEGFTRIGCVGCPMTSVEQRRIEFDRWPRFESSYRKAFDDAANSQKSLERPEGTRWQSGQEMWDWWMGGEPSNRVDEDELLLFDN